VASFPALPWSTRLRAIRKLATRDKSYLLIAIKPDDLVLPRDEAYVIAPVLQLLQRAEPDIVKLLTSLRPGLERAKRTLGPLADNGYFSGGDAFAAYALIQHLRPRRIIEIGGGHSTLILREAARDAGLDLHITCIDPTPRTEIDGIADAIMRCSVLRANIDICGQLGADDILFIDGSHYAFNGTDVPFLYLEVLPRLSTGVVVHAHDIMLPYEYSPLFTERCYNEQYVLAALLLGSTTWQPMLPVHWLSQRGQLPAGASFWMRHGGGSSAL
jgi:hypothetical protein